MSEVRLLLIVEYFVHYNVEHFVQSMFWIKIGSPQVYYIKVVLNEGVHFTDMLSWP